MVSTCSVIGCYNRSGRKTPRGNKKSFYRIPAVIKHQGERTEELSSSRRALWLTRLNRPMFVPSRYTKICSDHFIDGKPSALYNFTSPDWAPSLELNTYKKSKRGSKYTKKKTPKSARSSKGGAPKSQESRLHTTKYEGDITAYYCSVGKINNSGQSSSTTDADGLMKLELSRHNQKSNIQAHVLNYRWNASTQTELETYDFACQFPPERTSPTDIDHSYVKRPFMDKVVSSCELSDKLPSQEFDDSNSPVIEIVLPVENEPELVSQLPIGSSQPGAGFVVGNTEQNTGDREITDTVEKSESNSQRENTGVYPVYLQIADGEGYCL